MSSRSVWARDANYPGLAWPLVLLSSQNQTFLLDYLFGEQIYGWLCSEKQISRINVKDFKLQISLTPPWKQEGHETVKSISKVHLGFKPSHHLFQMTFAKYISLCLRLNSVHCSLSQTASFMQVALRPVFCLPTSGVTSWSLLHSKHTHSKTGIRAVGSPALPWR